MQGLLIRLIVIKKVVVASLLLVLSVAAAVGSQVTAWPAGCWRWDPMP